jgi:hypothetical protein
VIGRKVEINEKNMNDPFLARKDINFNEDEKHLIVEEKQKILSMIRSDAEFFEDLYLMDYSVLVLKLEFKDDEFDNFINSKDFKYYKQHFYYTNNQSHVYMIMIIDYLQLYNNKKWIENRAKNLLIERPNNEDEISCVPPDMYCKRLNEYFKRITDY